MFYNKILNRNQVYTFRYTSTSYRIIEDDIIYFLNYTILQVDK